jgi:hypothetical protein
VVVAGSVVVTPGTAFGVVIGTVVGGVVGVDDGAFPGATKTTSQPAIRMSRPVAVAFRPG